MKSQLEELGRKLQKFGKEQLQDILHYAAAELKAVCRCKMVHIYLEDLYEGMLICQYVTGQSASAPSPLTQFISPKQSITSRAFYKNQIFLSWESPEDFSQYDTIENVSGIRGSAVFPIVYIRPIGVLRLDWPTAGELLQPEQIDDVKAFLAGISPIIDRAKRYHQEISFSRHVDLARKKEAAWLMVRSAVKLIEKLTMASVLVPRSPALYATAPQTVADRVEILAAYAKDEEDPDSPVTKARAGVLNAPGLTAPLVQLDKNKELTATARPPEPTVSHEDTVAGKLVAKAVAQKARLASFYQIAKFHKNTGRFICAVNYYTNVHGQFDSLEKQLLEEHASMLEKLILEEGPARAEIEVLSEIEALLSDQDSSLQSFLDKILHKTTELLGADSGTISILKIIDGKPWLVVEDEQGALTGAKSGEWKKSTIRRLPVGGGKEVPDEEKSLSGYCAFLARPILIKDVKDPAQTLGYYKSLSPTIQSEVVVPVISGNSVIGVINQDSVRKNYFTEAHKDILQIIARLISQKVQNLMQIEDLRQEINRLTLDIKYRDPKISSYYFGNVIGKSQKIHSLVNQIDTVVQSVCNVMLHWEAADHAESMMGLPSLLITGETGSGKEFFFNNIYSRMTEIFQKQRGLNRKLPVKKTNIAAYSGELTYSELFGHKKGAFTGAEANRIGILEEANGGVVFLDEIGDIDPKTQVQLLRYLDTGVFMRLGENEPRYSKIFLVAATNKNLLEQISRGLFREDLYHRLNELSFHIPSLNERKEDIGDLAIHFLGRLFNMYYKSPDGAASAPVLDKEAVECLRRHHFRGNVRELRNILLRALLFRKGPVITAEDIAATCRRDENAAPPAPAPGAAASALADKVLQKLESGESDFWQEIHRPFKDNALTRDTVKTIIQTAKARYHAKLPGLAVKLRACSSQFQETPEEMQKFVSFKNFLYKTVKITVN